MCHACALGKKNPNISGSLYDILTFNSLHVFLPNLRRAQRTSVPSSEYEAVADAGIENWVYRLHIYTERNHCGICKAKCPSIQSKQY